ncbi:unnamed protein product, partial [Allacma fusca]
CGGMWFFFVEKIMKAVKIKDQYGPVMRIVERQKLFVTAQRGFACRIQTQMQPGSMDSEAGIFSMTYDLSGTRLITTQLKLTRPLKSTESEGEQHLREGHDNEKE